MSEQEAAENHAAELVDALRQDGTVHATQEECAAAATRVWDLLESFPRSEILADQYAGACWGLFTHELSLREQQRWIRSLTALRPRFPASLTLARTLACALALSSADLPTSNSRLEVVERIETVRKDHAEDEWLADHLAHALRAAGASMSEVETLEPLAERARALGRRFPASAEIAEGLAHLLLYLLRAAKNCDGVVPVTTRAVAVGEVQALYDRFPREEGIAEALAFVLLNESRPHEDAEACARIAAHLEGLLERHPDSRGVVRGLARALRLAGLARSDEQGRSEFVTRLEKLRVRFPDELSVSDSLELLRGRPWKAPLEPAFEREGHVRRRLVVHAHAMSELRWCLANGLPESGRAGVRDLLQQCPGLRELLIDTGMQALAEEALGGVAFPIAALMFDKLPGTNWSVAAHQDLALPVLERVDAPGFTGWSTKGGVPYVLPPDRVLAGLVALRLHLDPCPAGNGALAVLSGSHSRGRWPPAELAALRPDQFRVQPARTGDVLLLRPLLVHRSAPAVIASRRRVLHVVYAREHPLPVRWRT